MQSDVLVVHGYKIKKDGGLELLALAVCELVLFMHIRYKYIVLLGGMHDVAPTPENPTISHAMKVWLIEHGVPAKKLLCWDDLPEYLPPRDAIEEVDSVPLFLRLIWEKDSSYPRRTNQFIFHVAAASFMGWRLRHVYMDRQALVRKIQTELSLGSLNPLRLGAECVALPATFIWPKGNGDIFTKVRERRTFGLTGLPILPSNWENM